MYDRNINVTEVNGHKLNTFGCEKEYLGSVRVPVAVKALLSDAAACY